VMVCWVDDLLVVARGISGADAMSGMLSVKAPGASLAADKAYQAVAAGTGIKDWAFRWHVSVKAAIDGPTTRQAEENRQGMHPTMKALGLDRVVAVGGSEGFADKLVTRRLLVYAPEADLTMRLIRPNGSYQRGLAMTPRGAVLSLAGEIDTKVLVKLLFPPAPAEAPAAGQGDELVQGPATRPDSAPEEESAQAAITRLVQASDGHAAVYLLNMGMMEPGGGNGESGFPAGLVMGLKDAAQARQAVEQLAKLAPGGSFEGEREGGAQGDDEAQEASATQPASAPAGDQPETYRGAAIHRAGPAQIALLKDRVVVAVSRSALRAAVNAALDNKGGLPADGKTLAMVQLEGQGALLARIDMARLAKTYWPVVLANASDKDSILASIPTTEKIVSMLGSEVVLVQAVDGGILLKSRGYVPLLAKGPLLANFLPFFRFMP
ncbi:MAG: hypothetical protein NTV86_06855, partial [Planctomycetota bacterium]|nr:hypothetical protein [Planctomycetota bacterium]